MHRLFEILELLRMIIRHLDRDSLAKLSRTARIFHGPSIAQLYERLDGPGFIKLGSLVLRRDLDKEKPLPPFLVKDRWNRFDVHANMVRTFQILRLKDENTREKDMFYKYLSRLAQMNRSPSLLPNLRTLRLDAEIPQHLDGASLFLGASLERVIISVVHLREREHWDGKEHQWVVVLGSFLEALTLRSPSLQCLVLKLTIRFDSAFRLIISSLISNLQHLTELSCDIIALEPTILPLIASLPHLAKLRVGFKGEDPVENGSGDFSAIDQTSFPSLRILHLYTRLDLTTGLLKSIHSQFEELDCEVIEHDSFRNRDLWDLANHIEARGHGLQRLNLRFEELGERTIENRIRWDSFTPLLHLPAITHIYFEYQSAAIFDLYDSDIQSMSESWPTLQSIEIILKPRRGNQDVLAVIHSSRLTLAALAWLAIHCTHLQNIHFSSFATATAISVAAALPVRTNVLSLDVGISQVIQPERVAAIIDLIWPNVEICWGEGCPVEYVRDWSLVMGMLAAIRYQRLILGG